MRNIITKCNTLLVISGVYIYIYIYIFNYGKCLYLRLSETLGL